MSTTSRRRLIQLAGAGTAVLALSGGPALAQTKIQFKAATQASPGADMQLILAKLKELAEARSKGEITVNIFHSSMLGSQQQMQEQVVLGVTEMITSPSQLVEMEPKFGLFDFPFLFADRAHAYRVLDGEIGKQLSESLVKGKGVRAIAYGELGFRQITNRVRPIMTADDLKGLKIRVPPSRFRTAVFQALDAAPTTIDYKELYGALQQGVVDGQENPLTAFQEKSMWEVQKFISITNHVFTPAGVLVNERWWRGLSAAHRDILQATAGEAALWQRAEMERMESTLIKDFEARGVKIDKPNLDSFVAKTRPVWKQFEAQVGTELVEAALKAR
ncbi:MAG: TRAP transporter substrate-binding protein [Proteobacteria bacterium]|nr:TRAP transporter substrate-binding protein [Pseudomonadota bacterium]